MRAFAYGRRAGVAALAAVLAACTTAGSAPTHRDIAIAGSRVHPESLSADAAGNLYNGSANGTIYRTPAGSKTAMPWIAPGPANGLRSLFGVLADDRRGVLWVCNNPNLFARETGTSSLKSFALATGELVASYDFPSGAPTACNDIAVARDGTVWVTETSGGRIFVLAPGASALALFAAGPDLVGVDGIAFAGDGTLYINNVRRQQFQRVERKADGSFDRLTTLSTSSPLNGPDGLRPIGGHRFIQGEGGGGRVAIVTVDGDTAHLTDVATGLDGPVGVEVIGSRAYAVEGKIGYLVDPALRERSPDPFTIRAFPLPEGR